ncbi:MAG: prepilin-type N-terminal cleavage/methylation domain-containing protein, partial [Alphaproteobacteria bacterium]|nr:prepilin-type N-terminal cleavage/methylation domain-containing protein [Alphaproteobacteria bacterium]
MLFKNKSSSANQSGRSMIEMLGVLAIIGVLSAGGIAGYTMAMATFKTNKAMDMIQIVSA